MLKKGQRVIGGEHSGVIITKIATRPKKFGWKGKFVKGEWNLGIDKAKISH
jgi:hypothetical protein